MELIELSSKKWHAVARTLTGYTFFSSEEWLEMTAKIFKLKNYFFCIRKDTRAFYVSVQQDTSASYSNFIGYGGFITNDEMTFLEFKECCLLLNAELPFPIVRMKCSPRTSLALADMPIEYTSILDMSQDGGSFILSKKIRYALRKIEAANIVVRPLKKEEVLTAYDLYLKTAARVGSAYRTPIELFESLFICTTAYGIGVFNDDVLHAASIFMYDETTMYYWWNMSDEQGRKANYNYLLIEQAILFARKKKLRWLDMASSHSRSIRLFKKNWGALDKPFIFLDREHAKSSQSNQRSV